MCGIVGIVGDIQDKVNVLKKMNDLIAHRGPDDEGFFYDGNICLAMRRLAIIDLEKGKQPITTENGKYTIVFNGEIYNYKILKEELMQKGYMFKTDSDTEVILQLYQAEKENMVSKLRGMFSFAIYNKDKNSVFIARDYFGIKPLYYIQKNDAIIAFGSEIKSLLVHPQYQKEINNEAVYNYLSFQYNPLEETFFKGIWKVPPGHYMMIDINNGSFTMQSYWSFQFIQNDIPFEDMQKVLKDTIKDSVNAHMIADVPVASFLSGGIDSGVIASLASDEAKKHGKSLSTFTVGFNEINEFEHAQETAQVIESDHQNITISWKDYFDTLPTIVWHFDEPVADPSAVALYLLAREARKKVKVVLSGEGADELFGGYNIYLEPYARRKLQYIPRLIRKGLLKFFSTSFIAIKYPHIRGVEYLKRSLLNVGDWYIGNATIFNKSDIGKLWKGEKYTSSVLAKLYDRVHTFSDSTKMQYIDINTWLVGDILAKADKMTMANSLELRVPFLDTEIATIASGLTDRMKWQQGETKYLFREAVKNIVPETTRARKKLGFPTPITHMIKQNYDAIEKTITENSYINEKLNVKQIQTILHEHKNLQKNHSRKIYALLLLGIWHKQYFAE